METRKFISLMLVMVLALSLLATGVGARASCDMAQCRHHDMMVLRHSSELEMGVRSRNCCPEPQNDPCDLEKGRNFKIYEVAIRASRPGNDDPTGIVGVAYVRHTENPFSSGLDARHHIGDTARSAPATTINRRSRRRTRPTRSIKTRVLCGPPPVGGRSDEVP